MSWLGDHLRGSSECTLVGIFTDSGKRIGDDRNEQVDEPEIEDNNTDDEEEARDEEFSVHHGVHQRRPLQIF